jgi:hypothetical protein
MRQRHIGASQGAAFSGARLIEGFASQPRSGSAYALPVDAKDDVAKVFYVHFGFKTFQVAPLPLYLPLGTWRCAIARWMQQAASTRHTGCGQ